MKNLKTLLLGLMVFAGATLFGQVSTDQIEKNATSITDQISNTVKLTEDEKTLVYRQAYTYQANMLKFGTVNDMNEKMTEAKNNMEKSYVQNIKQILGEERFAEVEDLLIPKK